jgi:hypothetical protein
MGQETQTPTTEELISNASAQLTNIIADLAILNTALTSLGVTNCVLSPTAAVTQASINAVAP